MMQEELIKAALLGTGKVSLQPSGELDELARRIAVNQEDREDSFLKYAGAVFLYQESGLEAAEGMSAIEACPPETKIQLAPAINQYLKDALLAKDEVLFDYLLTRAAQVQRVASANLVPLLLNKALERKEKTDKIRSVCGVLGEWLCGLNQEWKLIAEQESLIFDWETDSHQERKQYFRSARWQDPAASLDLLEAGFEKENAVNRAEFIDLLEGGLSVHDEEFLTKSLGDKSKKVKDSALRLLRGLSGSGINQRFKDYLLQVISVTEERHLLLLKRKVLHLDTANALPEELLYYGIEKVSSQKGVADNAFQVAQLFAYVNPAVLAQELKMEEAEFVRLLLEHPQAELFRPFLTEAATRFKNTVLAERLLAMDNGFNAGLIGLVSEEQKGIFIDKYLEQYFIAVLDILLDDSYKILPLNLAERIIKRLAVNPYQVTQPVYQRLALSLPATASNVLQAYINDITDDYQRRYFVNQASTMLRYIDLRASLNF